MWYNKIVKNKIITGESALFIYQISDFFPLFKHVAMKHGTNISTYKKFNKLDVSTQKEETLWVGAIEYDESFDIYIPERLFVEFESYMIQRDNRMDIYKKLEQEINPQLVNSIYQKLKPIRRGLNHIRIKNYLGRNLLNIDESLNNPSIMLIDILREYVAALMYQNKIMTSFDKNSHVIEIYGVEETINKILKNKDNLLYFKFDDEGNLIPVSRKTKIQQALKKATYDNKLQLKINSNYQESDINSIIKEFKLPKTHLKLVKNGKVYHISKEMILSQKLFNLVTNKSTNPMDDLLEVVLLYEQEVSLSEIKKWIFVKFENYPYHKLDKDGALLYLQYNKDIEPKYSESSWMVANHNHKTYISYYDARLIYKKLLNKIIE